MSLQLTRRGAILGGLGTLAVGGRASAQDKIVLKMGTLGSTEYFYYKGAKRMAEEIAAKSGNRVDVQVFPNQQLGNERDMIEGMQLGTIDLAVINTPLLAGFDSRFLIFDMPFMFNDWAHVEHDADQPYRGRPAEDRSRASSSRRFAFSTAGFRHVLNYKRAVAKPEDMSGLKIRTLDNPGSCRDHECDGRERHADAVQRSRDCAAPAHRRRPRFARARGGDRKILRDQQVSFAHRPRFHWRGLSDEHEALSGAGAGPADDHRATPARSAPTSKPSSTTTISTPNPSRFCKPITAWRSTRSTRRAFRARMQPVFDRFQDRVGKDLIDKCAG